MKNTIDLNKKFGQIQSPLKLPWKAGTLSVVMIVKNEAKNIRDAIVSFRPIADEIIVNDTGSTDGTQQILNELGVKWIQSEWKKDFSEARNRSLELATSAWVIWLDADDRIPPEQIQNFKKLKSAPLDRAFGFQVINTQSGQAIGSRFMQLRMFPNDKRLRFVNKVHEQVVHSIADLGLHCFYTDTTIHHHGYENDELKREKARRNLKILEEEQESILIEPSLSMSEGDSWYILEEWEKGISAYQRTLAIPQCKEINFDIWTELPNSIGRGLQALKRFDEAIASFNQTIDLKPSKIEPVYHKGECLLALNRIKEAMGCFETVISMPLVHSGTGNQYDVVRIYSFYNLAMSQFRLGEYQKAETCLESMKNCYPQVLECWQLLGQCRVRLNKLEPAREAFIHALRMNAKASGTALSELIPIAKLLNEPALLEECKNWSEKFHPQLMSLFSSEANKQSLNNPSSSSSLQNPVLQASQAMLSLCMIVKNEKKNLPACLQSVQGLGDELIIVDTGSDDGTQSIAQKYGANLIQSQWENDFSKARNESLHHANGKWILWLDADDILLPADRDAIRKFVESNANSQSSKRAFGLQVKNSQDGGITGSVFNQIRLFPNDTQLRFRYPVHEQILPALEEQGYTIEYLDIKVIHTGYIDAHTSVEKQKRNRKILEEQILKQNHVTPVTYYTLANACLDLGEPESALQWFEKSGQLAKERHSDPHLVSIMGTKMAVCLAKMGQHQTALDTLENHPQDEKWYSPEGLLVRAQVLSALDRLQEAKICYEKLIDAPKNQVFVPVDFELCKIKSFEFLGHYWHEKGNTHLAVELLKLGISIKSGKVADGNNLRQLYQSFQVA